MADFVMPKLGADMSAGTLIAWRKNAGDPVHRGDIVAEVETDKGVIDVEIFSTGVLDKLLIQPGEKVPVGTVLAVVRDDDAAATAKVSRPTVGVQALACRDSRRAELQPAVRSPVTGRGAARLAISPSARRLARELGVDPSTVQGTGRGGAIAREDIERAAKATAPTTAPRAPTTAAADRTSRMRQTIAVAMARSKREIPHYYLSTTIDMQRAVAWLAEENEKRPVTERLLHGVLLLKAVALALREVPELNAIWDGERVVPSEAIHVGVATSLRHGGLVAPALHDTDRLGLSELMQKFRDLVSRARSGGLRSSELSDPTITVTSLGEQGVEAVFPIIYPPQVAIVGFGKMVERPWVVEGRIVPRPLVTATLSADHRVSDGHRGGLFLAAVDRLLQEPSKL
jgi:pyruvate dehydrogenase E2 component (dihydrolipoamide acetyltransferase)